VNRTLHCECLVTCIAKSSVRLTFLSQDPLNFRLPHTHPDTHFTWAVPIALVPERVQPHASMTRELLEFSATPVPNVCVEIFSVMLAPGSEELVYQPRCPSAHPTIQIGRCLPARQHPCNHPGRAATYHFTLLQPTCAFMAQAAGDVQ
jgi:hypothetical protein